MNTGPPGHCPHCGAPIPADAPEGLCPRCLFAAVVVADTPAGSDVLPSHPTGEQPGDTIGRYRILELLGEGGFGRVYRAEQKEPVRREVALKILKAGVDTRQVIARFQAERQALAIMDHPHIAQVYDAGATEGGRPYFVMELVPGEPITAYCDRHQLNPAQRLELFIQVCQGVQHAHQKGIIHRDLKPANVLVIAQDGQPAAKVIDFGVAKALSRPLTEMTVFTRYGDLIGTPPYISPEQADPHPEHIDTRADIYGLGALLYELLTGSPPFDPQRLREAGFAEILRILREEEPLKPSTQLTRLGDRLGEVAHQRHVPPSTLTKAVHGDLDWIVMKALEKQRTRRYQTVQGLVQDIERHLNHEPVQAAAPSTIYRLGKFVRRHRTAMAFAVALGGILLAGATVSTWQAVRATKAERLARVRADSETLARAEAEKQQLRAEQAAEEYRRLLYAADMQLCSEAAAQANLPVLRELLQRHVPQNGQEDLRGFEWYCLWRLGHPPAKTVPFAQDLTCVGSSGDGETLAAASGKVITLLRAATGTRIAELRGHLNPVHRAVFLPGGQGLLSVGGARGSGEIILWDLEAHRVKSRQEFDSKIWDLAVSSDGRWALMPLSEFKVVLWEIHSWRPEHTVGVPYGARCVAISDDAQYCAYGGAGRVYLWNRAEDTPRLIRVLSVKATHFLPGGHTLVVTTDEGAVLLIDASTGTVLTKFVGHASPVFSIASTADGRRFATASEDRTVVVWNSCTLEREWTIRAREGNPIEYVAFGSADQVVATAGHQDPTLYLSSLLEPPDTLTGFPSAVWALALSPDGRLLATGAMQDSLKLWDVRTGRLLAAIPMRLDLGKIVEFSPDGKWLAAASYDGDVRLVEPYTYAWHTLHEPGNWDDPHLSFSPDSHRLAVSSAQRAEVEIWDVATLQIVRTVPIECSVRTVCFSPDGQALLTGPPYSGDENHARHPTAPTALWDAATGKRLATWPMEARVGGAFSPDGQTLAFAYPDNTVRLFDVSTQELRKTISGHGGTVRDMVWWPDGKTLATAGTDNRVRIWRVETGQQVAALRSHTQLVVTLSLSRDGSLLASGSFDRTVRFHRASSPEEVRAGGRVGSVRY